MLSPFRIGLAALLLPVLTTPAWSAGPNLVQDGNFEQAAPGAPAGTENFSSQSFDMRWIIDEGTTAIDTGNAYVYGGDKSLFLNTDFSGGTTSVSQALATLPGQAYTLSFYADTDASDPLHVSFGAQVVGGGPVIVPNNGFPYSGGAGSNASRFTFFSYDVAATAPDTRLSFSSTRSAFGTIELDDVSVTPRAAPAPVPEASAAASLGLLLAAGMAVMVGTSRRRKRAVRGGNTAG